MHKNSYQRSVLIGNWYEDRAAADSPPDEVRPGGLVSRSTTCGNRVFVTTVAEGRQHATWVHAQLGGGVDSRVVCLRSRSRALTPPPR